MREEKSYEEINERIARGEAQVLTAEEMIDYVEREGEEKAFREVDVVTTATFGAMCSSGAFLNFGHSEPPIKMGRVWLNGVLAYAGLAAVDVFLGATQPSDEEGIKYGGAHVIEDLLAGETIHLRAEAPGTDCYPRRELETHITLEDLNQAYLLNPRNCYQNYGVAVNSSDRTVYTYMGTLLPGFGNATYSSAGQLSPLLNDPLYRTIGIGTRIFLGGAVGYIAWEGTQHAPKTERSEWGIPLSGAGTVAVIGDLKEMSPRYIRAAAIQNYGVSMYVGIGIPIPIVSREMVACTAIKDDAILTTVYDYGVASRNRPDYGKVSYAELRSGAIRIAGCSEEIPTAPLSSYRRAREIATELKGWIEGGDFLIQEPVQGLPLEREFGPLAVRGEGDERA